MICEAGVGCRVMVATLKVPELVTVGPGPLTSTAYVFAWAALTLAICNWALGAPELSPPLPRAMPLVFQGYVTLPEPAAVTLRTAVAPAFVTTLATGVVMIGSLTVSVAAALVAVPLTLSVTVTV